MVNAEWKAARADYEGGMKRKAICDKYGCGYAALDNRIKREGWKKTRESVERSANEKRTKIIAEKISVAAADNATIAESIKKDLLLRLKRTVANFPQDATEVKTTSKGKTVKYSLRDLTAAFKDLTADMPQNASGSSELLQSLLEMEKRHD